MFDFLRKESLWNSLDLERHKEIDQKLGYQLKVAQDLAAYELLRDSQALSIAEIGGGDSRLLSRLALNNTCWNIDRFEGANAGPREEVVLPGVRNLRCFLGDDDPSLPRDAFDIVFSISVVEHVEEGKLARFHDDVLRLLKTGGKFVHLIDMYLKDEPYAFATKRLRAYRAMVDGDERVRPLAPLAKVEARFSCAMVTNPDNVLHSWNRLAPGLNELRKSSQNVSLIVGGMKVG